MKLMIKYLRPFAALLLACLVLLFGQAMCDLSLPNLMSDIVNVGIQQSGIQTGAPEALSGQGMELLQIFLSDAEKRNMDEDYWTIEPGSSESQRFSETYPLAREETICVLRDDLDEEGTAQAGTAYG